VAIDVVVVVVVVGLVVRGGLYPSFYIQGGEVIRKVIKSVIT
jgi:hypothetical protein